MSYPIVLLNDPPAPEYPEYEAVVALARQITPRFVNPANLHPERSIMFQRGDDWCTAVLARPAYPGVWMTVHEQYLLIAADRLGVDPPLPGWIVEARREGDRMRAEQARRVDAARERDRAAWADALAGATVELDVHEGGRGRVRGSLYEHIRHAVPRADVYSGVRKFRTHPAGRALCETPTRSKPLGLSSSPSPDGSPATCARCLEWAPRVRATEKP